MFEVVCADVSGPLHVVRCHWRRRRGVRSPLWAASRICPLAITKDITVITESERIPGRCAANALPADYVLVKCWVQGIVGGCPDLPFWMSSALVIS